MLSVSASILCIILCRIGAVLLSMGVENSIESCPEIQDYCDEMDAASGIDIMMPLATRRHVAWASRIIILKVQEHLDMLSELMDIRTIAGEKFINPN